jgi:hypothetical protein
MTAIAAGVYPLPAQTTATPDLYRATLRAMARHPGPMAACGLLTFAGATIIGSLIYVGLTVDAYLRSETYFGTIQRTYLLHFYVRAAIGALLFVIGRGAVTWIALNADAGAPVTTQRAFKAALVKWRPLLLSAALYGGLVTLGVSGWALMMRELRMDPSNFRFVRADAQSMLTAIAVQGIAVLPPDPGSPFAELISAERYRLSRSGSAYYGWGSVPMALRNMGAPYLLAGLGGALLLILSEALACLRTAVIMRRPDNHTLSWLPELLQIGRAHFWRVFALRWGLRLLAVLVIVIGIVLPALLHQSVLLPLMARAFRSYWVYSFYTGISAIASALIFAALLSFQTVFEARLLGTLRFGPANAHTDSAM